eukprot:Gb_15979 [translate_table: standard]
MDSCAPFGSLTIMMGHPSLRWSTFGHTTSCVHVIHRKYRLRLHASMAEVNFKVLQSGKAIFDVFGQLQHLQNVPLSFQMTSKPCLRAKCSFDLVGLSCLMASN